MHLYADDAIICCSAASPAETLKGARSIHSGTAKSTLYYLGRPEIFGALFIAK